MFNERIEHAIQSQSRDLFAATYGMIAVHQNLRLNHRYQPGFLAERSEPGERLSIRFDAGLSWNTFADRNHRPPFGEARSELPILVKSLAKAIESLRDLFSGEFGEGYS